MEYDVRPGDRSWLHPLLTPRPGKSRKLFPVLLLFCEAQAQAALEVTILEWPPQAFGERPGCLLRKALPDSGRSDTVLRVS